MSLHLARNKKAVKLLRDENFRQRWVELYRHCPWGTVFQDVNYLSLWHRNYKTKVELVLVYETDEFGDLTGLLPVTRNLRTNKLCIAGDYHAEYQTWLAKPENGNAFAEKALSRLAKEFPNGKLQLMFLAPNSPVES